MIVIDPKKTFEVKVDKSTVIVRALTVRERLKLQDLATQDGQSAAVMYVLETGIQGWKNVVDGSGKQMKYSVDLLDHLDSDTVATIFDTITNLSTPSAEEAGK